MARGWEKYFTQIAQERREAQKALAETEQQVEAAEEGSRERAALTEEVKRLKSQLAARPKLIRSFIDVTPVPLNKILDKTACPTTTTMMVSAAERPDVQFQFVEKLMMGGFSSEIVRSNLVSYCLDKDGKIVGDVSFFDSNGQVIKQIDAEEFEASRHKNWNFPKFIIPR